MARPISLFSVSAILILAIDDSSRILTKYYQSPHPPQGNPSDYPGQLAYKTVKDQKAFEKGLLGGLCPRRTKHIYRQCLTGMRRENRKANHRHYPL